MLSNQLIFKFIYAHFLKPVLFAFDPELVHDFFTFFGSFLGASSVGRKLTSLFFAYKSNDLVKTVKGIEFDNPVGLSAGFDYDGHLVKIMKSVGFGFNTVGTVTYKEYKGNPKPRLARLVKSKSLLVNKGFKSQGVHQVVKRLTDPYLANVTFGVSVGSSNIPEINTIDLAINDYLESFKVLETSPYIKYYELNISCPNTVMTENFTSVSNFTKLLSEVKKLNLKRPVFIKMPNEIDFKLAESLVSVSFENGFDAFIFSNLVKDRTNSKILPNELEKVAMLKGNFSGSPTFNNALNLVKHFRALYGNKIFLVGCGGILSPKDALTYLNSGADLVQLITGLVFEGPSFISEITKFLSKNKNQGK